MAYSIDSLLRAAVATGLHYPISEPYFYPSFRYKVEFFSVSFLTQANKQGEARKIETDVRAATGTGSRQASSTTRQASRMSIILEQFPRAVHNDLRITALTNDGAVCLSLNMKIVLKIVSCTSPSSNMHYVSQQA